MNKETSSSGMGVKVASAPFELKTSGYYGYFDDWLENSIGKIADSRLNAPEPPTGASSSIETGESISIQWLVTDESNIRNYVDSGTEEDDIGIRPGSFGSLSFSIVPKNTETLEMYFELEMIPYRTVYQTDGSGTIILNNEGLPTELEPQMITGNNEAVTFLMNHVLFFKERSGSPGNYVYSGLIPMDEPVQLIFHTYYLKSSADEITCTTSGAGQSLNIEGVTVTNNNNVGVTGTVEDLDASLRVAIVVNGKAYIFAPVTGATTSYYVNASSTATTTLNGSVSQPTAMTSIPAVTANGTPVYVYLYFEGEDAKLKTDNVTTSLDNVTVAFKFKLVDNNAAVTDNGVSVSAGGGGG